MSDKIMDDIGSQIIDSLDLNERVRLVNPPESEVGLFKILLSHYISMKQKDDDRTYGDANTIVEHDAHETMEIGKLVWERLRETHMPRVVE